MEIEGKSKVYSGRKNVLRSLIAGRSKMVRRVEAGETEKGDEGRGELSRKKREKNVLLLLEMHDDETRPDRDAKRKETEKGRTQLSPRTDAACFSILS